MAVPGKQNGEPLLIPTNTCYAQFLNRTRIAPVISKCTLGPDGTAVLGTVGDTTMLPAFNLIPQYTDASNSSYLRSYMTLLQERNSEDEALDVILAACELLPWDNVGISDNIKKNLDHRLGAPWHVVVGESYGFEITFEGGDLIYVYYGSLAVMAWKCGQILTREIKYKPHNS